MSEDIGLSPFFNKAIRLFMNANKQSFEELLKLYRQCTADFTDDIQTDLLTTQKEINVSDVEHRKLDKLKKDLQHLSSGPPSPKRSKYEGTEHSLGSGDFQSLVSHQESKDRFHRGSGDAGSTQVAGSDTEEEILVDAAADDHDPLNDSLTDSMALDLADLSCVACGNMNVSQGNQLVECQSCHMLYHQECHKPPVPDEDTADPRFAWTCSKCIKTLKKQVNKLPNKPSKSQSSSQKITSTKMGKPEKPQQLKLGKGNSPPCSKTPDASVVKPGPFPSLSSFAAKHDSAKQKQEKGKSPVDSKPGSFLFADPIRLGKSESGSSKSLLLTSSKTENKVISNLSVSAKAEAVARSTNKPIDNAKYSGFGKPSVSRGGGKVGRGGSTSEVHKATTRAASDKIDANRRKTNTWK